MNGNEQFAIGDKVRSKKTGFVGTISKLIIGKESTCVIAHEAPALFAGVARIYIGDLEHVAADPAPVGGGDDGSTASAPSVKNDFKVMPPNEMENMGSNGGFTNTVIVDQPTPAKPKPAENIVIGIDLKVSDEGKAMLDQLKSAAENTKAVGLTSGETKPSSLQTHEKDAIKQALLDAARGGHLTNMTAYELIDQFQQVDES